MKIVIFGKGFIGGALGRLLKNRSQDHALLGRAECDLLDSRSVHSAVQKNCASGDVVVVAASVTRGNVDGTRPVFTANEIMARNLRDQLEDFPLKAIFFLSTCDVYGRPPAQLPILDSSSLVLDSPYAESKRAAEKIFSELPNSQSIRLPGVFGLGDRGRSVVGSLRRAILSDNKIRLVNDGKVLRDFIDPETLLEWILMKISQSSGTENKLPRQPVNLCSGQSLPLFEWAKFVCRALGARPEIESFQDEMAFDQVFLPSAERAILPVNRFNPELAVRKYCEEMENSGER